MAFDRFLQRGKNSNSIYADTFTNKFNIFAYPSDLLERSKSDFKLYWTGNIPASDSKDKFVLVEPTIFSIYTIIHTGINLCISILTRRYLQEDNDTLLSFNTPFFLFITVLTVAFSVISSEFLRRYKDVRESFLKFKYDENIDVAELKQIIYYSVTDGGFPKTFLTNRKYSHLSHEFTRIHHPFHTSEKNSLRTLIICIYMISLFIVPINYVNESILSEFISGGMLFCLFFALNILYHQHCTWIEPLRFTNVPKNYNIYIS